MGFLADLPLTFPGYTARLPVRRPHSPASCATAGYTTLAVGKWHLTPRWQRSAAGPFDRWPLGLGFERHYGFLQGDTNHWTPNLVCDNHYIDAPRRPEDGYHLSEDLADQAIRMVARSEAGARPASRSSCTSPLGAMHAPHQVDTRMGRALPGRFDRGWDTWREEVFARQVASGNHSRRAPSSPSHRVGAGLGGALVR